jgi:NAD(P)-dependent dehydrogenase (short-subunit alcohol dehydrogenase family)
LAERAVEHGEAAPGEIEAVGYGCDVSNEARVKEVFASIKERFGRIDCLVTAAGSFRSPFSKLSVRARGVDGIADLVRFDDAP